MCGAQHVEAWKQGALRECHLCYAPRAAPGPDQTGSGARREGSAAHWSVQGCEQLDPANEASLSGTGLSPLCSLLCLALPTRAREGTWLVGVRLVGVAEARQCLRGGPGRHGARAGGMVGCRCCSGAGDRGPSLAGRQVGSSAKRWRQRAGEGGRAGGCCCAGARGANEAGDSRSRPAWAPGWQLRAARPPRTLSAGQWAGESRVWGAEWGAGQAEWWPCQCCPPTTHGSPKPFVLSSG